MHIVMQRSIAIKPSVSHTLVLWLNEQTSLLGPKRSRSLHRQIDPSFLCSAR